MRTAQSSQHHDLSQVTVLMTDRKGQKWGLRSLWVCVCVCPTLGLEHSYDLQSVNGNGS